jgi:hypothetical protein
MFRGSTLQELYALQLQPGHVAASMCFTYLPLLTANTATDQRDVPPGAKMGYEILVLASCILPTDGEDTFDPPSTWEHREAESLFNSIDASYVTLLSCFCLRYALLAASENDDLEDHTGLLMWGRLENLGGSEMEGFCTAMASMHTVDSTCQLKEVGSSPHLELLICASDNRITVFEAQDVHTDDRRRRQTNGISQEVFSPSFAHTC